jgi:hypothetical protein
MGGGVEGAFKAGGRWRIPIEDDSANNKNDTY